MEGRYSPIISVMLTLTHACNLRCRYCFVQKEPQTMTLQTAKDAVDFLINNCTDGDMPSINFFGGEPMLCWDSIIVPLTKYIREELKVPFQLSMTTNGTLLNEERIKFMKDNQIGLLFSVDGGQATQDYNRPYADGSGSFASLKSLIPMIAQNFNTTFRMTTIPGSCGNLFEDIMFAEKSGFNNFFVIPNVFETWSDDAWDILSREIHKYADYFIECYQTDKEPIRFSTFEETLKKISRINNAVACNHCRINCNSMNKCGLGTSRFASIHPNGDMYACQEMTSNEGASSIFWIGNIYTGVSDERRKALSEMFDKDKIAGKNCTKCKMRRICDGGCVANNYLYSGDVNTVPETYCRWLQLLLDETIRVVWALSDAGRFIQEWKEKYGLC